MADNGTANGALVSVVVPTFQRAASVERLLTALEGQTLSMRAFEVVIAIDGSTDGTRHAVAARGTPYRLRSVFQERGGRSAACNAGIRASVGELVVLLDDDMEPSPGCLEAHLAAHTPSSRRCVVGAAPIVQANTPSARYVAKKFNDHLGRLARPGHRFGLRDFYSGNASIPRRVFEEVGLFDEDFTAYGNEDLELSLRLRTAGIELAFDHQALAHQRWEKDFAELAQATVEKGATAVLLVRKHPDAWPELKLAQYGTASLPWRLARAALLSATRRRPPTAEQVVRLVQIVERFGLGQLPDAYRVVLDYLYWVGADAASRAIVLDSAEARDDAGERLLLHR